MSTYTCYINSLESLEDAETFFTNNKDNYEEVVFSITGCEPLTMAPILLHSVKSVKRSLRGENFSIEGLDDLKALSKRAKELESTKEKLEELGDTSVNRRPPRDDDDDGHTDSYYHTTDLERLENCIEDLDINAMHQLHNDVYGNIARYEYHSAMVEQARMNIRNEWLPNVERELYHCDQSTKDESKQ